MRLQKIKISNEGGEPQKKKSNVKVKRNVYNFFKKQVAYGLSEGLGIFASYDNISVSASGSTLASSQNNVFFSGEVSIIGESYNKTLPLSITEPYIISSGRIFIGTADFNIPSKVKNFTVNIKAGYIFRNGDNLISVPISSRTTFTKKFKR